MKQRKPGLTRRELAAGMAALSPLAAQQGSRPPDKLPDELQAARGRTQNNSEALRTVPVSTLLEPSFVFEA